MNEHRYNGWTNYQTWCVNLWLSNDQSDDEDARCLCQSARDNAYEAGKLLRDYVEDMNPHGGDASLFSDLLSSSLRAVDWEEIASHYISDLDPEEEDEEEDIYSGQPDLN